MMTIFETLWLHIRPHKLFRGFSCHFNIQNFLSEDIERIQKRALNFIVPFSSYVEALKITGITTLYDRRESLCDQFFRQNMNNDKMTDLFPDPYTSNYGLRLQRKFNN